MLLRRGQILTLPSQTPTDKPSKKTRCRLDNGVLHIICAASTLKSFQSLSRPLVFTILNHSLKRPLSWYLKQTSRERRHSQTTNHGPTSADNPRQKQKAASNRQGTANMLWHFRHGTSRKIRQIIADAAQMGSVGDVVGALRPF